MLLLSVQSSFEQIKEEPTVLSDSSTRIEAPKDQGVEASSSSDLTGLQLEGWRLAPSPTSQELKARDDAALASKLLAPIADAGKNQFDIPADERQLLPEFKIAEEPFSRFFHQDTTELHSIPDPIDNAPIGPFDRRRLSHQSPISLPFISVESGESKYGLSVAPGSFKSSGALPIEIQGSIFFTKRF